MSLSNSATPQKKVLYKAKKFRAKVSPLITIQTNIEDGVVTTDIVYRDGFFKDSEVVKSKSLPRFTASNLSELDLATKFQEHLRSVNEELDKIGTNGNINILEFLPKVIDSLSS